MATTRYVWERYKTSWSTQTKYVSSVSFTYGGTVGTYPSFGIDAYGKIYVTGAVQNSWGYRMRGNDCFYGYHSGAYDDYTNIFRADQQVVPVGVKAGNRLSTVSSVKSNAYTTGATVGSADYYEYKGSDNIDPTALTYSDAVTAGQPVTLTIAPSTGTTLGGNISYVIQTTTNGTDWYDAGETSETSYTVTVPEDAIVWNVRVYAKDDTGFTSSTYVYGNGVDTYVNVIRVGISPPSGNIGYITDKNVMYVSVNADSAYTFTVKMGGETLSSSSSSSTVQQITLTDEKFNALKEDTPYTLTVEIVISDATITREYTFRKFTYDSTTTEGVWTGIGRAVRIRRKMQSQILGASAPKEIIKIDNPVSTQELQAATATPDKVVKGYTFYAGNNELKTGTLSGMTKVAQMSINDRISPTSNNATKTYTINTNFTPLILRTGIDMEGEVHTNVSSDGISYSIYVYKYIEGLSTKINNTVYSRFMGQDTSLTYQNYDNPLHFDVKFNGNTVTISVTAWSVKGTIYVYGI